MIARAVPVPTVSRTLSVSYNFACRRRSRRIAFQSLIACLIMRQQPHSTIATTVPVPTASTTLAVSSQTSAISGKLVQRALDVVGEVVVVPSGHPMRVVIFPPATYMVVIRLVMMRMVTQYILDGIVGGATGDHCVLLKDPCLL